MSLQFIMGNSGSGKSHYLCQYIVKESDSHPEKNYIVLVPEQFTMQTQKDFCLAHPKGGIMNIDVLSFGRLAHRVFEKEGGAERPLLDDEGKSLVIRRVAGQCDEKLKVLRGNLKKQGYISEIREALTEFAQFGVSPQMLRQMAEGREEDSYLYRKLWDLSVLYEEFESYLRDKYIVKEEMLELLCRNAPTSHFLKGTVVAIDGFTGFTPIQEKVIGELLKVCEKVVVTVEMDEREKPYTYTDPFHIFAKSRKIVTSIERLAKESGVAVEEPICLYGRPLYRFKNSPQLSFLEEELFRGGRKIYEGDAAQEEQRSGCAAPQQGEPDLGQACGSAQGEQNSVCAAPQQGEPEPGQVCGSARGGQNSGCAAPQQGEPEPGQACGSAQDRTEFLPAGISLHVARNPLAEARYTAEGIRYLVRTKGYCYRDIAVIAADMSTYADAIEKEFGRMGIPLFMDYKKSILENAFVEFVRSLLSMAERGFTYESVFRHLRTGLYRFTWESIDRVDNYCLATGVRGYGKWKEPWTVKARRMSDRELEQANETRGEFARKLEPLMEVLSRRKKTVREVCTALHDYFLKEKLQKKLSDMEAEFAAAGELALAKEYAQIYRIVIELLDKFVSLLGDECVSLKEFCELLDAGLEEAKVGIIPPGLDQVMIGDIERTRTNNVKAIFFMGANDTLLPGNLSGGGLLSEEDRRFFEEERHPLSPGPEEEIYIQKFYLYMSLTKPSEILSLSWSKVSGDGKSLRPAYLVQEVRRLFPNLPIVDEENKKAEEHELTWRGAITTLADGLGRKDQGLTDEWKEIYSWFQRDEEGRKSVESLLPYAFKTNSEKGIPAVYADLLYPGRDRISVSRLEQFAACAYAHFVRYGLRLSEREEYNFQDTDFGNILHRALELFAKKADERNVQWHEMPQQERELLADGCIEESIQEYGNTVLHSSARNEALIVRLKTLLRRSVWALTKQMEGGDFTPKGSEVEFPGGKIDRVETYQEDDNIYVKVTDYKTGTKTFDLSLLYHGLQLQLPLYLRAAIQSEMEANPDSDIIPAGIFYYIVKDPIIDRATVEKKGEDGILEELRLDGILNADADCLPHLDRRASGKSLLYPFSKKSDGTVSDTQSTFSRRELEGLLSYAGVKVEELKDEMFGGAVKASPHQMGDSTACDYCKFRDICGFDLKAEGYAYRKLDGLSWEDAVSEMMEKGGTDGHGSELDAGAEEGH